MSIAKPYKVAALIAGALVMIPVLFYLFFWWVWYEGAPFMEVQRDSSPSREFEAVFITENYGATTATKTNIFIVASGTQIEFPGFLRRISDRHWGGQEQFLAVTAYRADETTIDVSWPDVVKVEINITGGEIWNAKTSVTIAGKQIAIELKHSP